MEDRIAKANKGICVLRKAQSYLPRFCLLTIYKSFIRPHLDYGDVVYDQPNNNSLTERIETIQYNAALAITGAIRGASKERLYQELGLESLTLRRWLRKLCLFYKIFKNENPPYLYNILPRSNRPLNNCNDTRLLHLPCRTEFYSNTFFLYTIQEWNKLDNKVRHYESFAKFKNTLIRSIRTSPNNVFSIRDSSGLKLLTRLRLGLSHLREHKFNHNFQDTVNPLCPCSLEPESVSHFFLRCHSYTNPRKNLKNELQKIDKNILKLSDDSLTKVLLYGDAKFSSKKNSQILNCSIDYIKVSKRFEIPLSMIRLPINILSLTPYFCVQQLF